MGRIDRRNGDSERLMGRGGRFQHRWGRSVSETQSISATANKRPLDEIAAR